MNKRVAVFAFLVVLVVFIFSIKISKKLNHKNNVAEHLKEIPQLPVKSVALTQKPRWEDNGKSTIILFFNSECSHCQDEAADIQQKLASFKNTNLLFVSEESKDKIQVFGLTYGLDNQPNIWWLKMQPKDVYNTFGNIGVPHIWVYNKEGRLVKEFGGKTKIGVLLEWL